ncbi:MAG: preprotein translocase subunit YajC [Spirochaetaceae bacterium]|jgi:preprotein translocase subunit YajC|nr:preprotein translocase subunit YajC [Spirochaetaceae bacterium]
MKDFFLYVLMGAPAGAEGAVGGASGLVSLFPFVIIIAIFYFLIIRPQNKKQKETQRMLGALKKGDKVVTIGGIHGTIASIDGTDVIVKVDDNTKIKFLRSAISNVSNAKEEKTEEKEEKAKKTEKIEEKKNDKVETPVKAETVGENVEAKNA